VIDAKHPVLQTQQLETNWKRKNWEPKISKAILPFLLTGNAEVFPLSHVLKLSAETPGT